MSTREGDSCWSYIALRTGDSDGSKWVGIGPSFIPFCLRGHDPLGNQERHGLSIGPGPHPTTRVFCAPTRGYLPDLRMHGYTIFACWQAKPKPTGGPSHLARGPAPV